MDEKRQDHFLKQFMSRETKEAISELSEILEASSDTHRCKLKELITIYLQKSDNTDKDWTGLDENNLISSHDVIHIIREVLKNKLDFNNRLGGTRNIFELWQKSRAKKDEEGSVKLRESGNDCLRAGKIGEALHFYNEALLRGIL